MPSGADGAAFAVTAGDILTSPGVGVTTAYGRQAEPQNRPDVGRIVPPEGRTVTGHAQIRAVLAPIFALRPAAQRDAGGVPVGSHDQALGEQGRRAVADGCGRGGSDEVDRLIQPGR